MRHGNRPSGQRPSGDRPRGKRSGGERPAGKPPGRDVRGDSRGPTRSKPPRSGSDRSGGNRPRSDQRSDRRSGNRTDTRQERYTAPVGEKAVIWHPGPGARLIRAEAGQRLASFIAQMHSHLSVRAARRLLDEGCCRVNGRIETFGSRQLAVGDVVEVFLPEQPREHEFDPRRVVHDRDGILAYDKPAWLPVTPVEGPKSWSLLDILTLHLPQPLIPVHRLDADTSGIVLFARDERMARRLEDLFREHLIQKTYFAIVRGHPRDTGEHRSYLVKTDSGRGFERWKSGRGQDAREAITTWEVESRLGSYASLVKVMPKTGRYHQIRIHFSEMGHPIYGDRIYGDREDPIHVGRHLLHASHLVMPAPSGTGTLEIRTRLPREFTEAQKRLIKL